MSSNNLWPSHGVSTEELEAKAERLSREDHRFEGGTVMFFRTAGNLLRYTKQDFTLVSLVLFQVVIGLEKTLRVFYCGSVGSFKSLLRRAVDEGIVTDATFSNFLALREHCGKRPELKDAELFAEAVPDMRNAFFHGNYSLHPRFLPISLLVREAVDAILTATPDKAEIRWGTSLSEKRASG